MATLIDFILSRLALSIAITVVITQALKFYFDRLKNKRWNWKVIGTDGGMPSSHSSLVSSLTTAVFLETGFSYYFAISLIFALIVMRDAAGFRRAVGQHAKILNTMLMENGKGKKKVVQLRELLGHTPTQVVSGGLLGFGTTMLVYFI